MSTFVLRASALAAALALLTHGVSAQTPEPDNLAEDTATEDAAVELPTVKVTASSMQTTTGLELSVKETPQSVSVINQTQIRDQGITSVSDALRNTTGINVIRDGNRLRYLSRGFYIDKIEEDGVASTVAAGNSGNPYRDAQSTSDLAIYEHIEVLRGPAGLTQGNGNPGGTINAVRKKPTTQTQAGLQASVDQRGSLRLVGDVSGSLNEAKTLRGRLVAVGERQQSFKRDVDGSLATLYGVMDAQLGSNTQLTVGALLQQRRETPDVHGLPMGLNGQDAGLPRDTFLGLDWVRNDFSKQNLFAELNHYFNDDWSMSAKFNHAAGDSDTKLGALTNSSTSYAGLPPGGTLAMNNLQYYKNTSRQTAAQFNLNGKYHMLGQSHDLFAIYTHSRERSDTRWRRVRNNTAFDPFHFRGDEIAEPDWSSGYSDQTFYHRTIWTQGLTLGTRFNPSDRLHIIAGGRFARWKSSGLTDYDWWNGQPDSDPDVADRLKRHRFVPYLGVSFDLNPSHTLYASYASIYRPHASTDLQGRALSPVEGVNYELGLKSSWMDGRLNTAVALFQIEEKNRPVNVQDAATSRWYAVPAGRVRSRGLDAEVSGHITPAWKLFAGYTYNTSRYQENESSSVLAGMDFSRHTPRHMLRLYTSYRLPGAAQRWTIGAGVNAQSRTSSAYNVSQRAYALFNANVQYSLNKQTTLRLAVHNLTDKRYYENNRVRANGINNFYGAPRTFSLSLQWQL